MADASAKNNNFWVFRRGQEQVSGPRVFRQLANSVETLSASPSVNNAAINAVLRAGEFESGVADAGSPAQSVAENLTDALSAALLSDFRSLPNANDCLRQLAQMALPEEFNISPPEGFAYYALHPLSFATLAGTIPLPSRHIFVVGIRSIGTTLSAIVAAALEHRGCQVRRTTVRPIGHPYERVTQFTRHQEQWIHDGLSRSAQFLVVDEGPGRSGSSFLSVAEALTKAGVPEEHITLLGSRQADPAQLCAADAAARWQRFRFCWPIPSLYDRFKHDVYIGGGEWRVHLLNAPSQWPESWTQMERLKFMSQDRRFLFKFEGFGRFGQEVLDRACALARAGFGPPLEDSGDGMMRYPVLTGKSLRSTQLSRPFLEHVAKYCAFRAAEFRVSAAESNELPAMLGFNLQHEFGSRIDTDRQELCPSCPVIVDGRMQPHEWIVNSDRFVKVDGCSHGNDHFFPGPTDVAWDLAGAAVEWRLGRDATKFLLNEFRRRSGDNVSGRFAAYVLAYTVFRLGYCSMALSTVEDGPERHRLQSACNYYREVAAQSLTAFRNTPETSAASATSSRTPQLAPIPGSAA